ncbi:MAG: hypothetical protein J7501_07815 [Bdellovibrio sp.]|nr:hypothetical protein [Bdellovibrio sp.]
MIRFLVVSLSSVFLLSACASGTFKARQEQREKLAQSTGMFCQFVSSEKNPDIDVELSIDMARRCDSNRAFSITNFKNSSDEPGVIYCCATAGGGGGRVASAPAAPKKAKPVAAPATTKTDDSTDEVVAAPAE